MVRVSRVLPGSIAEEMGIIPGTELLSVNGRELADFLDWEFLTADDELVIEARLPDGEEIVYEIERPEGEAHGRRARAAHRPPLRQPLRVLLHRGTAEGAPQAALRPRRRLPPLVRLRQLRDALEREGARHRSASSSTACRRSTSRCTRRRGKRARCCSTTRASRTSSSSSRGSPRAAFSSTARWSSCPASTTATSSSSRSPTSGTSATPCSRVALVPVGAHAVLASLHRQVDGSPRTRGRSSTSSSAGRARALASAATVGLRLRRAVPARRVSRCPTPSTTATSRRSRTASARSPRCARASPRGSTSCRASTASASASSPACRWRR